MAIDAGTGRFVQQMMLDARTAIDAAKTRLDQGTRIAGDSPFGLVELGDDDMSRFVRSIETASLSVNNAIATSAATGDARAAALLIRESANLNHTAGQVFSAVDETAVPFHLVGTLRGHQERLELLSKTVASFYDDVPAART